MKYGHEQKIGRFSVVRSFESVDKKKVPILIHTFNRLQYLYLTLSSLERIIEKDDSIDIVIYDDGSTSSDMLSFLDGKDVEFDYSYDLEKKVLAREGVPMPSYMEGTHHVLKFNPSIKILRTYDNMRSKFKDKNGIITYASWKMAFDLYSEAPYIVTIEDDIIFTRYFKEIADKILLSDNESNSIGCIQTYKWNTAKMFSIRRNSMILSDGTSVSYSDSDGTGGQFMVIPSYMKDVLEARGYLRGDGTQYIPGENIDVDFHHFCQDHGYRVVVTDQSSIIHIGVHSTYKNANFNLVICKNILPL